MKEVRNVASKEYDNQFLRVFLDLSEVIDNYANHVVVLCFTQIIEVGSMQDAGILFEDFLNDFL